VEAVVDDRTPASLEAYYRQFAPEARATIEAIAMAMGEPYILATHACVPDAGTKIVFDRYHATRYVTEAVDKVRRQEHKALQAQDDLRLKASSRERRRPSRQLGNTVSRSPRSRSGGSGSSWRRRMRSAPGRGTRRRSRTSRSSGSSRRSASSS
jgi:transposase